MAVEATNYDKNKDYLLAEIADTYHPNLLINGDFKINQRGESSYSLSDNNNIGTLDMWRLYNYQGVVTVTVQSDGILITSSGSGTMQFYQSFDFLSFFNGITSLYASEVSGTVEYSYYNDSENWVKLGELKNGINTFNLTNANLYRIGFVMKGSTYFKLKYVDMFEGSIAYPHIVEDDAIALMRCLQYVKEYTINVLAYCNGTNSIQQSINFDIQMKSNPTCTVIQEGTKNNVLKVTDIVDKTRYIVQVQANGSTSHPFAEVYSRVVLLSCEPL